MTYPKRDSGATALHLRQKILDIIDEVGLSMTLHEIGLLVLELEGNKLGRELNAVIQTSVHGVDRIYNRIEPSTPSKRKKR